MQFHWSDRLERMPCARSGASLHFDRNDCFAISHYEIQLPHSAPPIPFQNDQAGSLEEARS